MGMSEGKTEVSRPAMDRAPARISQYSPEMMRMNAILEFMRGKATLSRISREQIVLESIVDAAEELGYNLKATRAMITSARTLSPGIDGLGRGEAVKVLVAHAQTGGFYPASAFPDDKKPGVIARLVAFLTGRKQETN